VFAYRPSEAPREQEREPQHTGRGVFGVAQLVELAAALGVLSQLGGMSADAEQDLVAKLKAGQGLASRWQMMPEGGPTARTITRESIWDSLRRRQEAEPSPRHDAPR
jgi:hypothetical protein